jgi:hypothetical protein
MYLRVISLDLMVTPLVLLGYPGLIVDDHFGGRGRAGGGLL